MTFILDIQSPPNLNQGGSSVSAYFYQIKIYTIRIGKDLDDIDIRVKFITGLLPDNRKHVDEFGIKKPLKELVKYLVRDLMFSTKIRKYKIRELKQGNELVRMFYQKLERFKKLSGCDEKILKKNFFAEYRLQIKTKSNHEDQNFL
ncbi:hypothetical protein GLOIN_2v1829228 [Rhizophagus irregularis DAOM 181602=DAOM 197198]|nr:hypothetical protein GLOIN_2v1829228 [Rhizophagus irregularis DAOM 181602=DAOM 197198]